MAGRFGPLSSGTHLQDPDSLCKGILMELRKRSLTRGVSLSCHCEEWNDEAISGIRKLNLFRSQ